MRRTTSRWDGDAAGSIRPVRGGRNHAARRLHGGLARLQAPFAATALLCPCTAGVFRIVPADAVLEDIRRQVAAGAEHITFGDPDLFNGPGNPSAT
jgi:hypothetical protein